MTELHNRGWPKNPNIRFVGDDNPSSEVLRIHQDGRIFWKHREVESDEVFRSAMIDLRDVLVGASFPKDQIGFGKHTSEFLNAVRGCRGELDGWLECNDEAECRAAILGAIESECNVRCEELEAEAERLRSALAKIADWNGVWGSFPERNEQWQSMAIIAAREAAPNLPERNEDV